MYGVDVRGGYMGSMFRVDVWGRRIGVSEWSLCIGLIYGVDV